jgi:hypothetical protein
LAVTDTAPTNGNSETPSAAGDQSGSGQDTPKTLEQIANDLQSALRTGQGFNEASEALKQHFVELAVEAGASPGEAAIAAESALNEAVSVFQSGGGA